MSIDYPNLFSRIGKLVKWSNVWLGYQSSLADTASGAALDIQTEFASRPDLVPGVQQSVSGLASGLQGWISGNLSVANAVLGDLQVTLNSPSANVTDILPLLVTDMQVNSQSVKACNVSAPGIAPNGANVGNGVLVASIDNLYGDSDQRIVNEVIQLRCFADQYVGASAGAEQFTFNGWPRQSSLSYLPPGFGSGQSIAVLDSLNLLQNGNFETWTIADTPDNWTIDAGAVGVNIFEETGAVHTGAAALELLSDGIAPTISLHQNVALQSTTFYAAGIWIRKNGAVAPGSLLQVFLTGTGFTPIYLFSGDPVALPTAYTLYYVLFATLEPIPSDLNIAIQWTSANTAGAGAQVLIDDCVVGLSIIRGFVKYALFRGSTDFLKGDSIQVNTANDNAGIFQYFFCRFYGTQLPTPNYAGNETIKDAWAR